MFSLSRASNTLERRAWNGVSADLTLGSSSENAFPLWWCVARCVVQMAIAVTCCHMVAYYIYRTTIVQFDLFTCSAEASDSIQCFLIYKHANNDATVCVFTARCEPLYECLNFRRVEERATYTCALDNVQYNIVSVVYSSIGSQSFDAEQFV